MSGESLPNQVACFPLGPARLRRSKMGARLSFGLDNLPSALDFREEIEKRVDALSQLRLDLLPRAFQIMHGDARRVSIFQLDRCLAYLFNLIGGQEP